MEKLATVSTFILKAISWFKDPIRPANLVMLYIEQPDSLAHKYGPNSGQVAEVVRELDIVSQYIKVSIVSNTI